MCGISLIISKNKLNIINNILKSLYLLQNRGYDSIGLSYYDANFNKFNIIKFASTEKNDCFDILKDNITNNYINSSIALGHTRWATHGSKSDINAHPHISNNKNIIIVHNGIITNFNNWKTFLSNNNYKFYSETDSEVIANLIDYYLNIYNNIESAIRATTENLEGTWALVIIYTKDPNNIYITRKGSPLLIGLNENLIICTSEINGFAGLLYDYISIDNDDIIKVSNDLNISNIINNNYSLKTIDHNNEKQNLNNNYKHWMLKRNHGTS